MDVRVRGKFERARGDDLSDCIALILQGVRVDFGMYGIVRIVRVFPLDLGGVEDVNGGAHERGFLGGSGIGLPGAGGSSRAAEAAGNSSWRSRHFS